MYKAGDMFIHPSARPIPHVQITQFNPLRTDNTDDVLDLLAYAPKVIELYGEYIVSQSIIDSQEFENLGVVENNSWF